MVMVNLHSLRELGSTMHTKTATSEVRNVAPFLKSWVDTCSSSTLSIVRYPGDSPMPSPTFDCNPIQQRKPAISVWRKMCRDVISGTRGSTESAGGW